MWFLYQASEMIQKLKLLLRTELQENSARDSKDIIHMARDLLPIIRVWIRILSLSVAIKDGIKEIETYSVNIQ
ncbi:hypothetical protein RIR_jg35171.t1 [Rhizophagus irregularis DAOM 181602=DAOM 197198]|nr:hypothetical protein RIR_jg35171.t1 [Rhizophagus irregularis DAOM 181602=DAOM 197198]